jgi:hypothetical protein
MVKSLLVWLARIFGNNLKEIIREPEPVAKPKPAPSIDIEPRAFFQWAGDDLARWELLVGARVEHTFFGKGTIDKAYRAQDRSGKIHLSIYIDRDRRNSVFFASDFNSSEKPFRQLLVDANCHAEFHKSIQEALIAQAEILEAKPIHATQATPDYWKQDWVNYEKILKQYRIQYLYHFTDAANIPSIIQHGGLYSWWSCQNNGISIPRPGGNELSRDLDRRRELHDYVRLSLNDNFPMLKQAIHEGRIEKPVILKIKPEVVYWKTTLYSNMNATSGNAQVGDSLENFTRINFEIVTQPYYTDDNKSFYQAEVLVKTHIPIQHILNLP